MGLGCSCFRVSSKNFPDLIDHSEGNFQTKRHMNNNDNIIIIAKKKRPFVFEAEDIAGKKGFKTLEDCLLDSPAVNGYYISNSNSNNNSNIGECYFHKQNKVHPSLLLGYHDDCSDYGYNYDNPRGSTSKQRLIVKVAEPALRKSRSKKTSKKRVSFRLPEEADIFVYNLTEEDD
ncbi:hypothetical protein M5689_014389 [Euphorbia peplus]|nr:hypothetical protein M5689_014389 [Euphorbia peplus]